MTKARGDDVIEDDARNEVDEYKSEKKEIVKKKGKIIITKPTKSSTTIFTRRTSRKKLKLGEEVEDVKFQMISTYISREIKRY